MTKIFFISFCKQLGIRPNKATKIINAKYKPYLSALDDKYYSGNDIWDTRTIAIEAFIRENTVDLLIKRLNSL